MILYQSHQYGLPFFKITCFGQRPSLAFGHLKYIPKAEEKITSFVAHPKIETLERLPKTGFNILEVTVDTEAATLSKSAPSCLFQAMLKKRET